MNETPTLRAVRHQMSELSARELEVLQLICLGHTTKEIGGRLGIRFQTASCHRTRLLEKAGVDSSILLFGWALTRRISLFERYDDGTKKLEGRLATRPRGSSPCLTTCLERRSAS